jgi:hypothetical protein
MVLNQAKIQKDERQKWEWQQEPGKASGGESKKRRVCCRWPYWCSSLFPALSISRGGAIRTSADPLPGQSDSLDAGASGQAGGEQGGPGPSLSQARIDVSIGEQKARIYDNNVLVKTFVVSTGLNDCTPLGTFSIQNRGEWFYSEKYRSGAKWWVSFKGWGEYLFHSVPMDRNGNIIPEEADKLGSPASHGCVRLAVDDAKWIYDHIPQETPVYIHN